MRKIGRYKVIEGDIGKEDGTLIPPDEPLMLFRAKDQLLPQLLEDYIDLCRQAGSPDAHVKVVQAGLDKVVAWQKDNEDQVKIPD